MSFAVTIPRSSPFWITGSLSNFTFFIFSITWLIVAVGFVVAIFFGDMSIAFIDDRSSFDFFIKAQRMSFSEIKPTRCFFSTNNKLPTRFFTIFFAQSKRLISGFTITGSRVMTSATILSIMF